MPPLYKKIMRKSIIYLKFTISAKTSLIYHKTIFHTIASDL